MCERHRAEQDSQVVLYSQLCQQVKVQGGGGGGVLRVGVCSEDSLLEFLHHSWKLGTAGSQRASPLLEYSSHWVLSSFLREIEGEMDEQIEFARGTLGKMEN